MKKYLLIGFNLLIINILNAQVYTSQSQKVDSLWQEISRIERKWSDSLSFKELARGKRQIKIIGYKSRKYFVSVVQKGTNNHRLYVEKRRYNLKGVEVIKRKIFFETAKFGKIRVFNLIAVNNKITKFDYTPAYEKGFKIRNNRLFSRDGYTEL
jgi:hypothetical protein